MKSDNPQIKKMTPNEDFDKAELDLLRASLKRSYTERFRMMIELMETAQMLKKAKVTHKANQ
jgi:hypothetical protein